MHQLLPVDDPNQVAYAVEAVILYGVALLIGLGLVYLLPDLWRASRAWCERELAYRKWRRERYLGVAERHHVVQGRFASKADRLRELRAKGRG